MSYKPKATIRELFDLPINRHVWTVHERVLEEFRLVGEEFDRLEARVKALEKALGEGK